MSNQLAFHQIEHNKYWISTFCDYLPASGFSVNLKKGTLSYNFIVLLPQAKHEDREIVSN